MHTNDLVVSNTTEAALGQIFSVLRSKGFKRIINARQSAMMFVKYQRGNDTVEICYHHGNGVYNETKAMLDFIYTRKSIEVLKFKWDIEWLNKAARARTDAEYTELGAKLHNQMVADIVKAAYTL